ncbi:AAA family ATPase [Deinococcus aquaticus]|uniref:AAA family ATPase n=1 Tax=Deinococcus aquaticus TaxID=328692 RepID=UPI003F47F77B
MFLRSLSITNLRSIEQLELSFEAGTKEPRKWTMLLAENGTGKTTLLRAIALVTAGSDALGRLLGDIDSWIRIGARQAEIRAHLSTAGGQVRDVALTMVRGDTLGALLDRNRDSIALLDAALTHADRNYFVVGYGASRRLATADDHIPLRPSKSSTSIRADAVATLFSNDDTLYPLSAWMMQLDYQGKNLNVFKQALDHLLPGATFSRIDRQSGLVLFQTPDGEVPLERLSDGYQNVAAWCGDLLRRITETFPDRKQPLNARGLLLIDEIDLHLHPQWQRKLIDFVGTQLPNFQIVCTTHSPITAQQVGPGELIVMRRPTPDQPPQLDPFEGDPRLLRIDQLIVSPIFGIETALSRQLEQARDKHRERSKGRPNSRSLEDLPVEPDVTLSPSIDRSPLEQQRVDLLTELKSALQAEGQTRTAKRNG